MVALITGSTSGIGWSILKALALRGHDVMLCGMIHPEGLSQLQAELSSLGVRHGYSQHDLRRPAEVEAMIEQTCRDLGEIDILVNNAGVQHVAPVEDFPPEKWDDLLALHLSAAFHAIRMVLPGMKEKGWGRIVNVASAHGKVASVNKAAYVAAKHGLVGLTKVVALENARTGVTCNAICPGWVLTPLVQAQIDRRQLEEGVSEEVARHDLLAEKQPSLRFVSPEELAELVLFLCGPGGNSITGAALSVDGGWTAQ
ncbi:MAG: 3-hydroxybutyrate dehydrogenase [Candidatus Xenobia bacterium]